MHVSGEACSSAFGFLLQLHKKTEKILSIFQQEVELNLECWIKNLKAFSIQPIPDLHLFKNC